MCLCQAWQSVAVAVGVVVRAVWAVEVNNYVARTGIKFEGTLQHSVMVETVIKCSGLCSAVSCPGFNLQQTTSPSTSVMCNVFSAVTSYTNSDDSTITVYYDKDETSDLFYYNGKDVLAYPKDAPSLTWAAANEWCTNRGLQMFIPTSNTDYTWMSGLAAQFSYSHTWLAATDLANEGTLIWKDGTSAMTNSPIVWVSSKRMYGNSASYDCLYAHLASGVLEAHMAPCSSSADGFVCVKS
ncbi:hypothetical protein Pmani_012145 [Petrolisthes manimaculis]|uniref:C-type lectin domain-containing protein n=1 Tax=Petrolisthes manimaculis TaxID=1843537 RepID=A0AAE1Q1H2_9EUCA|nr:hypothetical protein Pmani_012145 [Petrolisthes manimaculis]